MWLFHETGGGGSITSRSYAAVAPGGDAPTVLLKAALPHDRRSER
jgi:hypothetical protein